MSLNEDFDLGQEAQKAYDGAISNHWDGQILEPWTISRETASLIMGCKLLSDWNTVRRFWKTNTYPSALKDVVIVLWLLIQTREGVRDVILAGEDRAGESLDAALQWAEYNKISVGSKGYNEGVKILGKITGEKMRSQFEVESTNQASKKKGLTPRGK